MPDDDKERAADDTGQLAGPLPQDDAPNRMIISDEEGEEYEFEIIDKFEVIEEMELAGVHYRVLGLLDDDEEAVVLRVEHDDEGEEYLVYIEDDDEWKRVAEAWQEADGDADPTGA